MDTLPNELLLDILENLDYWDLTLRVPRICHRFRNLIINNKGSNIKRLLFSEDNPLRDVIPDYTPGSVMNFLWPDLDNSPCPEGFQPIAKRFYIGSRKAKEFGDFDGEIHPAFGLIDYTPGDRLEDVHVRSIPGDKEIGPTSTAPIIRTPLIKQNATSPAVSQLVLHVSHFGEELISATSIPEGSNAVSFEQVIQGIIDLHYAEVSKEELQLLWESMNQGDDSSEKVCLPREIFATQPGKYRFPGVDGAMMIDGMLHLFVTDGY